MTLVQLNSRSKAPENHFALFNLGFRPFFLGAAIFSVLTIAAWVLFYSFQIPLTTEPISLFEWHAHQMIYGFSMAVIAGFLLTAVMNWTGVQTLNGKSLQALFICWSIPRITLLFGVPYIEIAAVFDALFLLGLCYGITAPITRARQWRQIGILTKVLLLSVGNLCFYLDAFNVFPNGAFISIYGGLFLIISLILTIGGRVMPMFIRNGLDQPVDIKNPLWVAILSFLLFILFTVNFIFIGHSYITGFVAAALFVLTTFRLYCWHTPAIWSKPLLWGLFSSYIFINLGFLLYSLHGFKIVSPLIAAHAFSYGGIGLATLSMMARVSVGHTGRSIRTPPSSTGVMIGVLILGALIRVIFPLLGTEHYRTIIITSQALWILAFTGFILLFSKMLILSRPDGQAG